MNKEILQKIRLKKKTAKFSPKYDQKKDRSLNKPK